MHSMMTDSCDTLNYCDRFAAAAAVAVLLAADHNYSLLPVLAGSKAGYWLV